jgi:NADH-quinone oxidoreductase subunit J
VTLESVLPLFAAINGVFMIYSAYLVVKSRDLVYASSALALLGIFNAIMIALLGYYLVAAFLVVVYVGAAVMFIIVTVSMLGGRDTDQELDESRGYFTAGAVWAAFFLLVIAMGAYMGYVRPSTVSVESVSSSLLIQHTPVIGILFIALAATLIEAIAIARRG